MKRYLALLLSACILCGVLVGCKENDVSLESEHSTLSSETNVNTVEPSTTTTYSSDELHDIITDKYFTADPEDYPAEQCGEQIVDGDFGTALKDLNTEFKESGEGQAIIALYKEGDDIIQVHFSPSDKAIEENNYQTIAIEFISMAKLIISTINQYSDIPTKEVAVVLGRSSAVLIAMDPNEYGATITSFSTFSNNEELDNALQMTYDIVFKDNDVSNILS